MDSYQYDEAEYDDYDGDYGDRVTTITRLEKMFFLNKVFFIVLVLVRNFNLKYDCGL